MNIHYARTHYSSIFDGLDSFEFSKRVAAIIIIIIISSYRIIIIILLYAWPAAVDILSDARNKKKGLREGVA